MVKDVRDNYLEEGPNKSGLQGEPSGYIKEVLSQIKERDDKEAMDIENAKIAKAVAGNDAEHQMIHQTMGEKSSLSAKRKRAENPFISSTPENSSAGSSISSAGSSASHSSVSSSFSAEIPFEDRFLSLFDRQLNETVRPNGHDWSFADDMSMPEFLTHICNGRNYNFGIDFMNLFPAVVTEMFNDSVTILNFKDIMKELDVTVKDSTLLFALMKSFTKK
jgi:hypothetical protein